MQRSAADRRPEISSPVTPWWISNQPSGIRIGGGPAPIFSASKANATTRPADGRTDGRAARESAGHARRTPARRRSRCPGRSSVRPAGSGDPAARRDPVQVPHRPVQRRVARLARPDPAPARGRTRRPCSGTGSDRRPARAWYSKCKGPSRFQSRRSVGDGQRGSRARADRRPRRSSGGRRAIGHPGDPRVLDAAVVGRRVPSRRPVRAPRPRAADPDRHTVVRSPTSASPTRDTLPAATSRGSRYSRPSAVAAAGRVEHPFDLVRVVGIRRHHHPAAGSACTERSRCIGQVRQPFTPDPRSVETKWRWKTMNSTTTGTARTHRAGQDRAERVGRAGRDGGDVVGQRDREWLLGLLLGDQERPEELVPRSDEGQQHGGQQRRPDQRQGDRPQDA